MSWPLLCINIGDELACALICLLVPFKQILYIYDFTLTLRYIIMIDELVLPGPPGLS